MKKTTLSELLMMLLILVSLSACGGGGGGGVGIAPPAQPTQAVLTLSTAGTGTIAGIQATVTLPAGVSVMASPSPANASVLVTDDGVVSALGSATGADEVLATYVTFTTSSQVKISVIKTIGFTTGDFAVVNCNIAAGHNPAATHFTITDLQAVDQSGAAMNGLTAGLTVVKQ